MLKNRQPLTECIDELETFVAELKHLRAVDTSEDVFERARCLNLSLRFRDIALKTRQTIRAQVTNGDARWNK